jgi:protein involved in polysaccharide export with SLBB domain
MPASPVVGPGDEIVVKMWGRVVGIQRVTVDRDGKIFFPKFGSIYVAAKTFTELKSYLRSKVSTIHFGLSVLSWLRFYQFQYG